VDGIEVSLRTGVRRLRPSAPVVLFSVNLHRDETQGPWMEPLDPAADAGDPMSFVLPGFSSPERPAVELHRRGSHVMFALPEEIDSAQRSVTVASAYIIRHGWVTHRLEEKEWESRTYLLHYPCRQLVRDLYVREDLYFGSEPNVRLEFPGPAGVGQGTYRDKLSRMNELDMTVTIENLGAGAHAAAVEGIPGYEPLLLHAFDAAKLDPKRFRGYRVRLMYPVPMIGMGWWIRLPEGP